MQEEPQWEPLTCGIAETRGLRPDQWPMAINTCKMNGPKGKLCDSRGHRTASTARWFFCFCFVYSFKFGFDLWWRLQGKRTNSRRLGDKWNQNPWYEIHKKSIKVKKKTKKTPPKKKTVVTFMFLVHIFLLQITNCWLVMASNLLKIYIWIHHFNVMSVNRGWFCLRRLERSESFGKTVWIVDCGQCVSHWDKESLSVGIFLNRQSVGLERWLSD